MPRLTPYALGLLGACLPALSSVAHAGTQGKIEKPVGNAELAGVVSVDLLAGADARPLVWGWTSTEEGADPCTVELTSQGHVSTISEGAADGLKLKRKGKKLNGADIEIVTIPTLKVGDLTLTDVTATINEKMSGGTCVQLALPATGLAWAVTPSTGKAHFAPAAQAGELIAAVGGQSLPFTAWETRKVKFGKTKTEWSTRPYLVEGTVGGQQATLNLGFGDRTDLSSAITLEGPTASKGDLVSTWTEVQVGGLSLGSTMVQRNSSYRELDPDGSNPARLGRVGTALLGGFDVAVDPAGTIALKAAPTQVRLDPRPANLERAQAALDKCLDPDEPPTGEEAEKSPEERCAGAYGKIAGAAMAVGKLDEALKAREVGTTTTPNACDAWLGLGDVQLARGDAAAAATAYERAATLAHAWWDNDPWERKDLQKAHDDLEPAEQKAAELQPQASSCLAADGKLAIALLAANRVAELTSLAAARTDLDPVLPAVLGSQLILEDRVEDAHGPWRMVDHLAMGPSVAAKAGLGRLFANQGDWDSAMVNFHAALDMAPNDATVAVMWVEALIEQVGAKDALDAARKRVAERPSNTAVWLSIAVAAKAAGVSPDFAIKDGDPVFQNYLGRATLDADLQATWARFLIATGRADQAAAAVTRALEINAASPQAWLAKAELAAAQGGDPKDALLRAVQSSGGHPGYTLLVGKTR